MLFRRKISVEPSRTIRVHVSNAAATEAAAVSLYNIQFSILVRQSSAKPCGLLPPKWGFHVYYISCPPKKECQKESYVHEKGRGRKESISRRACLPSSPWLVVCISPAAFYQIAKGADAPFPYYFRWGLANWLRTLLICRAKWGRLRAPGAHNEHV